MYEFFLRNSSIKICIKILNKSFEDAFTDLQTAPLPRHFGMQIIELKI